MVCEGVGSCESPPKQQRPPDGTTAERSRPTRLSGTRCAKPKSMAAVFFIAYPQAIFCKALMVLNKKGVENVSPGPTKGWYDCQVSVTKRHLDLTRTTLRRSLVEFSQRC